jgi:hypothetical protein
MAVVASGVLVWSAVMAPAASAEPMPTEAFSTCKQLRGDYPNGIAKTKKAARQVVRKGYGRPIVCKRVYQQVYRLLDPNRNAVACEAR